MIGVYRGKVKIAYRIGNKTVKKITHNSGLSDMALLFAKAVSGNLNQNTDIPRLLDIGYIVPGTKSTTDSRDNGVWMSILNTPVNITGRQYTFDTSLDNWVARLTTTVYWSDINGGILDDVLEKATDGANADGTSTYQLKIRLCSYEKKDRKYLAQIDIEPEEVQKIKDSTSAIITWYTELIFDNDNATTTADINVVSE